LGRRKKSRKIKVYRPRKVIPKVFPCPNCGKKTVNVEIKKSKGVVIVKCGTCLLEREYGYNEWMEPVDYYSRYVDDFYEGVQTLKASGGLETEEE